MYAVSSSTRPSSRYHSLCSTSLVMFSPFLKQVSKSFVNVAPSVAHSSEPATMPSSVSVQIRRYLLKHAAGMTSRVVGSLSVR